MNSPSLKPLSKTIDTIKVVCGFTIFVSFITLFIVIYRFGASSNQLSDSVVNLKVEFQGINQKMTQQKETIQDIRLQTQTDSKEIQQLIKQMAIALYQIDLREKEFALYKNEKNLKDEKDQAQLESLKEQGVKLLFQIGELQKNVQGLSLQIKTDSQSLNEQIKKQQDEVISLSKQVSGLEAYSSKLQSDMTAVQLFSPKIEGNNTNIDYIKNDLIHVSSQLLNLQLSVSALPNNKINITNLEYEVSTINQSIVDLQSQISAGRVLNTIEKYGPFIPPQALNTLTLEGTSFSYYPTTTSCIIPTKGKALITLIATGQGICNNCQAQLTFLKNKKSDLPIAGLRNRLNGSSFLYTTEWLPINLTQQFLVEEGTHEFVLGINFTDIVEQRTAQFANLSFVATVIYYS